MGGAKPETRPRAFLLFCLAVYGLNKAAAAAKGSLVVCKGAYLSVDELVNGQHACQSPLHIRAARQMPEGMGGAGLLAAW